MPSRFSLQTEHHSIPRAIIDVSYPNQKNQKGQNVVPAEVHLHHELLTDIKLEHRLAVARFNLSRLREKLKKSAVFVKNKQKKPQLNYDKEKLKQQIHEQFVLTNDLVRQLKTKLVQQAEYLLELRAQAHQVGAVQYHAKTNITGLASGGYINISKHRRSDFNQNYKIIKIKHKGVDARWLSDIAASEYSAKESTFIYTNEVVLLQESIPFVPFPADQKSAMPAFIKGIIVDDEQDDAFSAHLDEGVREYEKNHAQASTHGSRY